VTCQRNIGGGRSFKVGGQKWVLGAVPQWGPGAKPLVVVRSKPPKADDTFVKNMLFSHGFKNYIAIFAFIACKFSILNGRENQFGGRKLVGRATMLIAHWA